MAKKKLLEIETPLAPDTFILSRFTGHEKISHPFQFNIDLISMNKDIQPESLVGKAVTISLNSETENEPRYFHGYVENFYAGECSNDRQNYYASVTSWLSFLNYSSDCRIFQDKTVIDITKLLFDQFKLTDFDIGGLKNSYSPRDYCVQYRESAFEFISRILQEEGIFYYFTHKKNKHTLMLGDDPAIFTLAEKDAILDAGSQKTRCLTSFKKQNSFYSGKHETRDYNFITPGDTLQVKTQNASQLALAEDFFQFDFPGGHRNVDVGAKNLKQRFESNELHYEKYRGKGSYSQFAAGTKFKLTQQTGENRYLLLSVFHKAADTSYLSAGNGGMEHYTNQFDCILDKVKFNIPHRRAKTMINGPQTAVVVGPSGEEQYIDKLGRVRVQFQWDREGKRNEKSTCWIRVAQLMAGPGWGTQFLPRIGQEVIVHFINGDPDFPVIIGTLYNGNNSAPYSSPDKQTQSGFKMHSTKNGGDDSNELRFEDKRGAEEIYVHAQKDLNFSVEDNENIEIIKGDFTTTVKAGECTIKAAKAITFEVGGSSIKIEPDNITLLSKLTKIN